MKWGIVLSSSFPRKIRFFDTTLRDGEQTPERKLRIARNLDKFRVDVIETVFAAASDGEMDAIQLIAREGPRAEVYSMARGAREDIDAVVKSDAKGVMNVVMTDYNKRQLREVS